MLGHREADAERRRRVEAYLDEGHGATWLSDPRIATLVEDAFLYLDRERYHLHAWVVMPNHVHVLITPRPGFRLSDIVQAWKSWSAKTANRILGRSGPFWQRDYFDRFIRDDEHFRAALDYIEENPVKAGLCDVPEGWRWSSARRGRAGETPALPTRSGAGETPALPGDAE
ncbi:MAG TPA: transposase [Chloroflexota bacterium]|nr:transposase [Chloroflexota bacterium]